MKTHPLLQPLRELAPEWAEWLCFGDDGFAYWSAVFHRGNDRITQMEALYQYAPESLRAKIHLSTGTVRLQQPDGTVIEVTRKEWDV